MYSFCSWRPWLRSSSYTCAGIGGPKTPSTSCHRGGLSHPTCFSWILDSAAAQQPKIFQVKQPRLSYWHFLLTLDKYFLELIHLIYRGFIHVESPTPLNTAEGSAEFSNVPLTSPKLQTKCVPFMFWTQRSDKWSQQNSRSEINCQKHLREVYARSKSCLLETHWPRE